MITIFRTFIFTSSLLFNTIVFCSEKSQTEYDLIESLSFKIEIAQSIDELGEYVKENSILANETLRQKTEQMSDEEFSKMWLESYSKFPNKTLGKLGVDLKQYNKSNTREKLEMILSDQSVDVMVTNFKEYAHKKGLKKTKRKLLRNLKLSNKKVFNKFEGKSSNHKPWYNHWFLVPILGPIYVLKVISCLLFNGDSGCVS